MSIEKCCTLNFPVFLPHRRPVFLGPFLAALVACSPAPDETSTPVTSPTLSPTPAATATPPPTVPPSSSALVLNELSCGETDWVELLATGTQPVSLEGMSLSDYPTSAAHTFTFAAGTSLQPGARLVVPGAELPFGLSCGDDILTLLDPLGQPLDQVELPSLDFGTTWGRLPDGTGPWTQTLPTEGLANELPPTDPSGPLFDPFSMIEVDLSIPPDSVLNLYADPYTYTDAVALIRVDGESSGRLSVGVRLKGVYGSFQTLDGKAAFKIKFNYEGQDQRFLGKKVITLNNMLQDPSMHHEQLAYAAFRALGIEAPRTGNAWVTVNGLDYGLYVNVETYDDVLLDERFDSTQHLYEGAYGVDVTVGSEYSFDVDEGDASDLDDLTALINVVNYVSDDLWVQAMRPVADLPELVQLWAAELYLGHWDGYVTKNNYFLHSDDSGIFRMLPWGTDQTFAEHLGFRGGQGIMFTRCLAIPDCLSLYYQSLEAVARGIDALHLDQTSSELEAYLKPYVDADPRKPYSAEDVAVYQQFTRDFITSRSADVAAWLACARDGDCPPCPELVLGGHPYYFCAEQTGWQDARTTCQKQDAELVIMESLSESLAVSSAVMDQFGVDNFWIGLSDLETEGDWRWVDGSTPGYSSWSPGEPNNSGEEDCAQQFSGSVWNDLPCSAALPTVCEGPCIQGTDADHDGVDACLGDCNDQDPSIHPGAEDVCSDGIDQDCSGVRDDGPTCTECIGFTVGETPYLACSKERTFDVARANCQSQGGDLATFRSLEDQFAVWDAFTLQVGFLNAYFGMTDLEEEGTWRWIDGAPVDYSYWSDGQPDNAGDEDYGGFFWDGTWNDWPGYYELASICEVAQPVID